MNTPAAKRRRVDAANATLRKPFHSPLLSRRQPGAGDNGTPGPSSTTPEANSNKRPSEEVYSPSSPSAARQQPQAARPLTNKPGRGRPAESSSPKPSSPLVARKEARVKGRKTAGPGDEDADEDEDDNPFLALARAHGTRKAAAERDAVVKDLDRRLDLVRQAAEIEAASGRRRPGGAVDQELRDLVARWRAAGRAAAEELFQTVKERVDNAGGPKAWREMQQRQMDFYRDFDQDLPAKSRDSDEDSDPEFSRDVRAHLEGIEEAERKSEEEEDQTDFNMGHMLQSLNIDFSLLGYDEKEDKWID